MNRESPTERSRISFKMKVAFASLVLIAILGATFAQESYGSGYVRGRPYGHPYGRPSHRGSHGNVKQGSGYHSGYPPCKLESM